MLPKTIIHRMAAAASELQSLLRFVKFGIHKKKKKNNPRTTQK